MTDLLVVDLDVHLHESPGELAPYCDAPWDVSDGSYQGKSPTAHEGARMVHDQRQMRDELDELDVDLAILFPDHLLKLPVLTQAPYAAAVARAYNVWMIDKWTSQEKGLLGAIIADPHDPQDAAREIEKYAHHPDVVGGYLPCAASTRCGATGCTTRSTRRRTTRICPCCCTPSWAATPAATRSRSWPTSCT